MKNPPWIRCPSMTGYDYFLATEAIIEFEESDTENRAYVIMRLPRQRVSRVLVPVSVRWLQNAYFNANGLAEIERLSDARSRPLRPGPPGL